jgi:5-methylthioadenosine/S-adenosylhomocysteine deaminase
VALRPHLPDRDGNLTALLPLDRAMAATPLSQLVEPMDLDPATVPDDDDFLDLIGRERNLPQFIKDGLPEFY